jgi:arsenate reductase
MNVLVLCTGNSARSILAEVLINELGKGRFRAFSAGSHPAGKVNPGAIDKLEREGHPTRGLASKSWDEFSGPGAQAIDLVITVCDNAAGESCPIWNGSPLTAHWGIPDPAAVTANDDTIREAFDLAYERLRARISALVELGPNDINRETLAGIHEQALQEPAAG